jgi:hypothetical protein
VKTISLKKRIALVAVAALGSTLVASVPAANAATSGEVTAINATLVTSSPVVGGLVTVNMGLTTAVSTGSSAVIKAGFLGASDTPTGGWVSVAAKTTLGTGSTLGTFGTTAGSSATASGAVLTILPVATGTFAAGSVASSTTAGAGSFQFTPNKAGTYILTVWHEATDAANTTDAVNSNEARQTVSITVAAAAVATGGASLMTWAYGAGAAPAITVAPETVVIPADKSLTGAAQTAVARVNVKGATGSALNGATLTASISGSGLVRAGVASDTCGGGVLGVARASSAVLTSTDVGCVVVSPDGSAGEGTITLSVTDPVTGATSTIGSFKVLFFSSTVATLTATQIYSVAGASRITGCAAIACVWTPGVYSAGSAGSPAVSIVAKDSGGNVIPGKTLTATSSDLTVIGSSTVVAVTDGTNDFKGLGWYNASVTGAASAVSGKTATVTYSFTNTDLTVIKSAPITFTIGGTTIATETLAFSKTSYAPGEAMVITRTAKDSAGNSVADGITANAVSFSKPNGGTAPAASFYVNGMSATSATTPTVFAPVTGGAFTASMTGGDAAATVRTASSSVVDGNAALLTQIDALNAKIVALNALIAKIMKKLGVK